MFFKGNGTNVSFEYVYDMITLLYEDDSIYGAEKILNDIFHFLLTHVLSKPKYCREISKQQWLSLIGLMTSDYLNQLASNEYFVEPVLALKVLRVLLSKCQMSIANFNATKLFAFFHVAISSFK